MATVGIRRKRMPVFTSLLASAGLSELAIEARHMAHCASADWTTARKQIVTPTNRVTLLDIAFILNLGDQRQIQQTEHKDPNCVHKLPIHSRDFNINLLALSSQHEPCQKDNSRQDMQHMQSRDSKKC